MLNKSLRSVPALSLACLLYLMDSSTALAQGSAFTYQGRLTDAGNPANGLYEMRFKLFDVETSGTGIQDITNSSVQVMNGVFTVQLDFGVCAACFNGAARFLEISIRPAGSPDPLTILTPRQRVTSTPYAIRSSLAASADGLSVSCVNCVTSSQIQGIAGSQVSGAIPVASVPAGSANYIQNTASQQASSNFNISSSGTVGGTLTANLVRSETQYNIGGSRVLSAPGSNLFAGVMSGSNNTTGVQNSFFGFQAGRDNSVGFNNSLFGSGTGLITTGNQNSFFGAAAGGGNQNGLHNSFFGFAAGDANTSGSLNTIIGTDADVGTGNLINASAIGANARVDQSDSLVLGSINGVNGGTASVRVGIGLTAPKTTLDVVSTAAQIRFGDTAADNGGYLVSTQPSQAIISGGARWNGSDWVAKSSAASLVNNNGGAVLFFADNGLTADTTFTPTQRMVIKNDGFVGIGTGAPADRLHVAGDIRVGTGSNGCVKDADGTVIGGSCSSDLRLKHSITSFPATLDKLVRLRPVHFLWRSNEHPDRRLGDRQSFGLIAQEVEAVMPELVTEDEQGYKAVRYNKLPVLMLQGIRELKAEKDSEIAALTAENDALKQQLRHQEERLRRLEAATGQPAGKD